VIAESSMTQCAWRTETDCDYQLIALISHLADTRECQGQSLPSVDDLTSGFDWTTLRLKHVDEPAALQSKFQEQRIAFKFPTCCSTWQTTERYTLWRETPLAKVGVLILRPNIVFSRDLEC
jgi:hypothetical protein